MKIKVARKAEPTRLKVSRNGCNSAVAEAPDNPPC
jgi:hypothetical protein